MVNVRLERLSDLAAELNAAVRILASVAERLSVEVAAAANDEERAVAEPTIRFEGFEGFGDD